MVNPQALLDAIRLGGRQHNRILRLSFPHDDGPQAQLLMNKFDAVESLLHDFSFTIELLSDETSLSLKDLQGKLFNVELVRGDGTSPPVCQWFLLRVQFAPHRWRHFLLSGPIRFLAAVSAPAQGQGRPLRVFFGILAADGRKLYR